LSSSSHDKETSQSGGSAPPGSYQETGRVPSTTSSSSSLSDAPVHAREETHDASHQGWATPMSAGSGSQAPRAPDPPEHGRASVADAIPTPSSPEVGPNLPKDKDKNPMSDTSSGSVAYQDVHAPTNANTQYFDMGNGSDSDSPTPSVVVDDDAESDGVIPHPRHPGEYIGAYITPTPHVTNPTQHATTPHAITPTPRVGARGGGQREFSPSSGPNGSVHTVHTGTTSVRRREIRGRPSSRNVGLEHSCRTRSAKRSADNDGDSSVVRQRVANDPGDGDPDPGVGGRGRRSGRRPWNGGPVSKDCRARNSGRWNPRLSG
jgi:hypothetical protein